MLTKSQRILHREADDLYVQNDEETGEPITVLALDDSTVELFGTPDIITLTIEAGDKLNEAA